MRHECKRDANHAEIADALRRLGCQCIDTSSVGPNCIPGFPDLLVVKGSRVVLVEVKMPGGKLTDDELDFARAYPGPLVILHSVDECLDWAQKEGMIAC